MKYIGLDISTTNIGYYTEENGNPIYGVLRSDLSNWEDRIFHLSQQANDLFESLDLDWKEVVISTAGASRNYATSQKLSTIEGVVAGVAFSRGVKVRWLGDSSWYNVIGKSIDSRVVKKELTLKYFMENVLPNENYKFVWEGGISKCIARLEHGEEIYDDVADAYAAAALFDAVKHKRFVAEKEDTKLAQRKKLRAENKKLRIKLGLLVTKIKTTYAEINLCKKDFILSKSKRDANKLNTRIGWAKDLEETKRTIELTIKNNTAKIKELS